MRYLITLICVALLFTACGGGGGTETSDDTAEPTVTTPVDEPEETPEEQPEVTEEPDNAPDTAEDQPEDDGSTSEENTDEVLTPSTWIYVIYAQDNEFLGVINDNPYDTYSVCNRYGSYGSQYSTYSIWNEYGAYGSEYRTLSAFNDYTTSPPIIYAYTDTDEFIPLYYLTTNEYRSPRIDSHYLLGSLQAEGCNIER